MAILALFKVTSKNKKNIFYIFVKFCLYYLEQNNFGGDIRGHRTNQCLNPHVDTEQGILA
jgi:hypothetical protein